MFILCGAFYRLELRTKDRLRWVQIASQALLLNISSASRRRQTGCKLDQITISYPQIQAGSAQIPFQVCRVEFTIIDWFTSVRWTCGESKKDLRRSSKRNLGVPAMPSEIRFVSLALMQMSVIWVSNALLMPLW